MILLQEYSRNRIVAYPAPPKKSSSANLEEKGLRCCKYPYPLIQDIRVAGLFKVDVASAR